MQFLIGGEIMEDHLTSVILKLKRAMPLHIYLML